jgi:hypothetical protein
VGKHHVISYVIKPRRRWGGRKEREWKDRTEDREQQNKIVLNKTNEIIVYDKETPRALIVADSLVAGGPYTRLCNLICFSAYYR